LIADQEANGIQVLMIERFHIYELEKLPFHHRDPFDRLLVAQAMVENIPILSNDPLISQYPIQVIW
jgi:PIN domain nuclease of toxin-antitoxin system